MTLARGQQGDLRGLGARICHNFLQCTFLDIIWLGIFSKYWKFSGNTAVLL